MASGKSVGKGRGARLVVRGPSRWLHLSNHQLSACLGLPSVEAAASNDIWWLSHGSLFMFTNLSLLSKDSTGENRDDYR